MKIKEIIKKLHTTMVDARGEDSHFQSWLTQNEGICDAIDALKELDKQEQGEPVAHFGSAYVNQNGVHVTTVLGPVAIPQDAKLYTTPQPEQEQDEPVAYLHWLHGPIRLFLNKDEAMMELDRLNREYPVDKDARQMRPLYTKPQPSQKPLTKIPTSEFPAVKAAKLQVQEHMKYYNEMMKEPTTVDRIVECATRLVEHADFKLGGVLSADSKSKDIPSKAVSSVKARHLAALRDALAAHGIKENT